MSELISFQDTLRRWLEQLADDRRRKLVRAILQSAEDLGMWMEERPGGREVPVALEPATLNPAEFGYLHHAAWQMRRALQRLPSVVEADEEAAALLPLSAEERTWFEEFRSPVDASHSRFCRVDALYRSSGSNTEPSQLSFIEPNVVGLGGLCYAVDAVDILQDEVFSRFAEAQHEPEVFPGDDPRELLAAELEQFLEARDITSGHTVALVGSRAGYEQDGEDARLVAWLDQHAHFDVVFVDPVELSVQKNQVLADGRAVDAVYRMMELSDLIEREASGADLDGMRAAFEQGLVIPAVGGDLEHKSVFELFTSERFAHHFSETQRRVFDRHVMWTRLLADRETTSPKGRKVDLMTYAKREREHLVLKPNRSYGGSGVQIGCRTSAKVWSQMLNEALESEVGYVLQALAPLVTERLPVRHGESFDFQEVYTVVGIFPSLYGCGLLGRYADEGVVNVSRTGGVLPFVLDFS